MFWSAPVATLLAAAYVMTGLGLLKLHLVIIMQAVTTADRKMFAAGTAFSFPTLIALEGVNGTARTQQVHCTTLADILAKPARLCRSPQDGY